MAVVEKSDVDPKFCASECSAGRVKGKCLSKTADCGHPSPRTKKPSAGRGDK